MNSTKQRSIGLTVAVMGVLMGVAGIVLDINGGPSALHVLTWVGGGLFGFGVVSFFTANGNALP